MKIKLTCTDAPWIYVREVIVKCLKVAAANDFPIIIRTQIKNTTIKDIHICYTKFVSQKSLDVTIIRYKMVDAIVYDTYSS